MWLIWKGWNGALFNGKVILPKVVVIRAVGCLSEFQCATSSSAATSMRVGEARGGWQKPCGGFFKITVDGSWKKSSGLGAFGVIIRTEVGAFRATANGRLDWCSSPMATEALAFRMGIQLGQKLGLRNVII
ncbi:hypothetical protein RHMOL_Rhmol03G0108300 [Rhododendron molle]|uniref:Uncharacterized protein n=1 Tax=Rhododendron molle TaxID=49168 RepID=A0ACC0PE18_RHOML|nr:hypothetical protein RHMOL_Rhmol03G0108300 [Rhododendron molle]